MLKHNYKKLISQYLTPKHTLWMDLLLLCLSSIVRAQYEKGDKTDLQLEV